MAHSFPASGGLQFSDGVKVAGVWFEDSGVLGPVLVVGDRVDGQWFGRWVHGPQQQVDWDAEVSAAGGDMQFLRGLQAQISNAIRIIFGTEAPPVPTTFIGRMNKLLEDNFLLDAGGMREKV